ncbi:MAG: N-methyl-L-tryptophan oxidase [Deltaproteobacteria bacterium]|nr:N-methyl-L-tryptophan oxidase [Deltaproteobacteria bacterium]
MEHITTDVVVAGVGGVGSAALWRLARRGLAVVGLDRFVPGHAYGSSHGQTRVFRRAYFEHPDYVPLAGVADTLWGELEGASAQTLRRRTGVLQIGPPDGIVVPGVLASARLHGLTVEALDGTAITRRFPGLAVPEGLVGVLEPEGGVLYVERCVRAATSVACGLGATLLAGRTVRSIRSSGAGYVVETDREVITCRRLVATPGAWAPDLLDFLGIPFRVLRKMLVWYGSDAAAPSPFDADAGCPAFLYELPDGVFYGCPAEGEAGVKVAEHTGGTPVTDPLELDRTLHPADEEPVRSFVQRCLPGLAPATLRHHEACMYTMTPDQHFVVGAHPDWPGLVFAAGLSGHGFKFASALGESLAALALDEPPPTPLDAFRPDRAALRA